MTILFEQYYPTWNCPSTFPKDVYMLSPTQPVVIDDGKLKVSVVGIDVTAFPQCSVVKINEYKVLWSCGNLQVTNISNEPVTVRVTDHRQIAPGDRSTSIANCVSEVAEAFPTLTETRTIKPGETVIFIHLEFDQLPKEYQIPGVSSDAVSVLEVERHFPWLWVIGGMVTAITIGGAVYFIIKKL